MVVMHPTFVKMVIDGMMVSITNQNVYGVNVLQFRMGLLLDIPVCQKSRAQSLKSPYVP